jgi:adenine-specific DNA methylase
MNAQLDDELTPAERFYKKHLERVKAYQKANPEKMREKCKRQNARLRENPEKYKEFLAKQKQYYEEVRKPKLMMLKAEKATALLA